MKEVETVYNTTKRNLYSIADRNTVYRYFLFREGNVYKNTKTFKNNALPDNYPMNNRGLFRLTRGLMLRLVPVYWRIREEIIERREKRYEVRGTRY